MNTEPKKNTQTSSQPSFRAAVKALPARTWNTIKRNWAWKLLALFLAICLWAGLITQDPTLTRERNFTDVPISISGAESLRRNGLIVLSGLEADALSSRLRVDVPQREYETASGSNYNPRIDLSRITATGEQTLKIQTTSSTTYGTVNVIVPDSLDVYVDHYITNYRVPVTINQIGSYPTGFYGSTPSLNPSIVAVSGPESIVSQIAKVSVDFDLSTLPAQAGTTRVALPIHFADLNGNSISSDLLEVTSADVLLRTIIIEQTLYATKTISISNLALTTGEPAAGYELKSVTASPSTLLAAGDASKLDLLDTLFIDSAIDITDRTSSFSVEVKLRKPSELAYLSTDSVTIYCEILPIMVTSVFDNVKLRVRNSQQGQSCSLSTDTVSVAITGPQLIVEGIKNTALTAYVDASTMTINPDILPILLTVDDIDLSNISYAVSPSTTLILTSE